MITLAAIKAKSLAIKAAVVVFVVGYIKYLRAKNERLEHNEEVREEIDKIEVKQTTDREEALENEKQTIKKRVKANSGKSRRDRASRL